MIPWKRHSCFEEDRVHELIEKLKTGELVVGFNIAHFDYIANQPYFDQVKIHEPIDISLVTRLANISEVEFNALNPAYNRYVIKVHDEPRTLLLPKSNKEIFLKNLETYQDPKVSWQIYRVKNGENINEIAARHSTTIKQLKTINGIARNKNITLGQKILVPHTGN